MKIITKLLIVFAVICSLCSCGLFQPSDITTSTTTETASIISPSTTKLLPIYTPGSIKLRDPEWFRSEYDIDYEMKYRKCYYTIGGSIEDYIVYAGVATMDEVNEFIDNRFAYNKNASSENQMPLKQIVEHFNLPREIFDRYVEGNTNFQESLAQAHPSDPSYDMSSEEWEVPNADIIYTFDDKIINEYYRRE